MSDELERTIRDSLDRHARGLGSPQGHLNSLWDRVDRRRNRRRSVATVGSVAVIGAGIVGMATIATGGEPPAPGADGTTAPVGTAIAWRCTDYVGEDGVNRYYRACDPVAEIPALDPPFTGPVPTTIEVAIGTLPPSYAPPYTGPTPSTTPAATLDATTTTTTIVPASTIGFCEDPTGTIPCPPVPSSAVVSTVVAVAPGDAAECAGSTDCSPTTTTTTTFAPGAPVATTAAGSVVVASTPITWPATAGTYRCSGLLGFAQAYDYLERCELLDADGTPAAPPSVVTNPPFVTTAPGATAPPSIVTNPPVAPTTSTITVQVPAMVGLTEGQALQLVDQTAGLGAEITYVEVPAGDPTDGTVVEQSATPGTELPWGTAIAMTVARANVVTVPPSTTAF